MYDFLETLRQLHNTTKRTQKEEILSNSFINQEFDLFRGFRYCYDAMITFGVKQVPESISDNEHSLAAEEFFILLEKLRARALTGNAAGAAVNAAMQKCSKDAWNLFCRPVLIKDMRCGITETTINKILKKLKAEDFIIPVFECQLAVDCNKHSDKMNTSVFVEPKYDGVRILAVVDPVNHEVILHTRNGKVNRNFPHVEKRILDNITHFTESTVLDGEIMSANFQKLMTQVNRKESVNTVDSYFLIFDILPLEDFNTGISKLNQYDRKTKLTKFFDSLLPVEEDCLKKVEYCLFDLTDSTELDDYYEYRNKCIAGGFEGIMIKNPTAPYECKRSDNWMKFKPTLTVDLEVVGVEAGTGKNAGSLGALVCEGFHDDLHIKVNVGSGFTDEQRASFWNSKDNVIGSYAEVLCDVITKNQNEEHYSLRFPRFVRFRDDKQK